MRIIAAARWFTLTMVILAVGAAVASAQPATPAGEEPVRQIQPQKAPAAPQPAPAGAEKQPEGKDQQGKEVPPADQKPKGPFDNMSILFVLMAALVLMWVLTSRSRRKQESKRKEMLSNLAKGDKITTIGGVIGTVIEVKEDEVTIKVDETNNTRMKFARWAIRGVGDEAKTQSPDERKK